MSETLQRLEDYYGYMISVIIEAKKEIQASLVQVYTQN